MLFRFLSCLSSPLLSLLLRASLLPQLSQRKISRHKKGPPLHRGRKRGGRRTNRAAVRRDHPIKAQATSSSSMCCPKYPPVNIGIAARRCEPRARRRGASRLSKIPQRDADKSRDRASSRDFFPSKGCVVETLPARDHGGAYVCFSWCCVIEELPTRS